MAEHEAADEPANDLDSAAGPGPSLEPAAAAVALALGRTGRDKDLNAKAAAYLEEQTRLARLQSEHLHEQRVLQVRHLEHQERHLRLRYFGDRLRIGLQLLGILSGLAVVSFLAALAWNAHEDHGVAIEAFSVPPDLAQRGLTGQVVASQVLDRLSELQARTVTARPASTYANDWGGEIKVEIPETGVSIGELNRYLRDWLGSETRIAGEVVHTPAGLAVTARAGDAPGRRFEGPEADVDKLVGQAAETVYAQTQPYRYAVYLGSHGRGSEAMALFEWLARRGSREDQAWAYGGWSSALVQRGDFERAAEVVREGERRGLDLYESGALNNLSLTENLLSRPDGLDAARHVLRELERTGRGFGGVPREAALRNIRGVIANNLGDYLAGIENWRERPDLQIEGSAGALQTRPLLGRIMIYDHDVTRGLAVAKDASRLIALKGPEADAMRGARVLQDWPKVVSFGEKAFADSTADPRISQQAYREIAATLAMGYARVGRLAEAREMLRKTLPDCTFCLAARAWVAELAGDREGADRGFAAMARATPDKPEADAEWGAAMLARGDVEGAIAKLAASHRKGPHFADPLETWGEALMAKRDYAGALAKFAEADRNAPRWGRNHMMWGEALMLSGRYAEARRQFEAAAEMDLSGSDRAALEVLLRRTATGPLHG